MKNVAGLACKPIALVIVTSFFTINLAPVLRILISITIDMLCSFLHIIVYQKNHLKSIAKYWHYYTNFFELSKNKFVKNYIPTKSG